MLNCVVYIFSEITTSSSKNKMKKWKASGVAVTEIAVYRRLEERKKDSKKSEAQLTLQSTCLEKKGDYCISKMK